MYNSGSTVLTCVGFTLYVFFSDFFRVDQLYAFFVQWEPELYGDDEEISAERRGFVVLEDEDKEDPNEMDVIEEYFNNGITALQKDWEVGVGM